MLISYIIQCYYVDVDAVTHKSSVSHLENSCVGWCFRVFWSLRKCIHFGSTVWQHINAIQKSLDLMRMLVIFYDLRGSVFFLLSKDNLARTKGFYLASKLNFYIDAFMYSIFLLNQSINSCIMLPISFSPYLAIQCQAILLQYFFSSQSHVFL